MQNTTISPFTLVTGIFNVVLSAIAVMGNALILTAIWKRTFERTSFHLVLSGLAFSDLCTGLFSQSLMFLSSIFRNVPIFRTLNEIGFLCGIYFGAFTLLIITLLSLERWMHTTRRSILTTRSRLVLVPLLVVIPGSFVVLFITLGPAATELSFALVVFMLVCVFVTFFAYFNLFRIIRQHQQQVQGNLSSQNGRQPAINVVKLKRSLRSIFYILALFSLTVLPVVITMTLILTNKFSRSDEIHGMVLVISLSIYFSSSSLNPVLYLWRMKDIRNGVKDLLCSQD